MFDMGLIICYTIWYIIGMVSALIYLAMENGEIRLSDIIFSLYAGLIGFQYFLLWRCVLFMKINRRVLIF